LRKILRYPRSGVLGLAFLLCLFMGLAPFVKAQTADTGVLAGEVTDTSGAVVANVTVTTTSIDTGQMQSVTTGADGS
jgi:hypothetical protein